MTIEAGALALRISEIGADQVLAKLGQIDAKARALGGAVQTLRFNVPSATGVNGQLQTLSMNFTRAGQAAAGATPALVANTAAQAQNASTAKNLSAQLGQSILGYYGISQVVSTATRVFDEFNAAADRQANAQRRLGATAAFTGASLAEVKAINAQAQLQFRLSAADSANLTAAFARLAFMSGNVSQTGKLMTAWMDLAAAQGMTLDQVMTGVNSTIGGQDEGLNRLGLMNPSGIWKKWADALGTTVGKMTDQQKFQAIINEVTAQGGKVVGEYARYLETAQGQQQAFTSSLEQFNAHIGEAGFGIRSWAYSIGTTLINAFVEADKWLDRIADKTSNWIALTLTGRPRQTGLSAKDHVSGLELSPNVDAAALRAQLDAAAGITKPPPKLTAEQKAAMREQRAAIEKALGLSLGNIPIADLTSSVAPRPDLTPTVGVDRNGKMKGVKGFGLGDVVDKEFDALMEKMRKKKEQLADLATSIAGSIASALGDAFTAAFSKDSDKDFFEAFGNALLASLGNIVMQLGASMLTYGLIASTFSSLLAFTPFAGITAGAAASIAAGTALIALGAGMGAIASNNSGHRTGGGGAGGGGAGAGTRPRDDNTFAVQFDPDRALRRRGGSAVTPAVRGLPSGPFPTPMQPVTVNATIIGPDDPRAQTQIAQLVKNAVNRGKDIGMRKAS